VQKANTAALLLALALGVTAAGCAPTKANGEQNESIDTSDLPMTADAGVTLPAGVLPPNNPPAPGDAPLGNDGHYNYDAPEFVLTNPCDDPEIMGRLEKIGFREQENLDMRIEGNKQLGCGIQSSDFNLLGIWHASVPHSRLGNYNATPVTHREGIFNWITFKQTNPIGNSACIASIETEKGALGFIVDTTGEEDADPQDHRCAPANKVLVKYLGEK
jgi:hypothetical protein